MRALYEFAAGDRPVVRSIASVTTETRVDIGVRYDNGKDDLVSFDVTTAGTRAVELFREGGDDKFEFPGRVTSLAFDALGVTKRGQYYTHAFLERGDVTKLLSLGAFYVTSEFFGGLGVFEHNRSGPGFLSWVAAFTADRAGNAAAVDFSLATGNAFRKVYGLAWYYHCSGDVASRTLDRPQLVNLGGAKPTGFTTTGLNAILWRPGAGLPLTADEEGAYISLARGKDGITSRVDDGTQTVENTASSPTPWPLEVTEDELGIIRFPAITNGEAADRHSAYVLIEEWLEE